MHFEQHTYVLFARQVVLTVESLNIVSGSHQRSDQFWRERLLPSIRSRFGELAVDHAEEGNIRLLLQPCIVYIIQRLQVRRSARVIASYMRLHRIPHALCSSERPRLCQPTYCIHMAEGLTVSGNAVGIALLLAATGGRIKHQVTGPEFFLFLVLIPKVAV